ncbi:MAG: M23 family metallopeptidase [Nitrosomonadales bacterium]|nr:M23 family metallopeptidase [Nitrosomonadales bacterium]
MTTNFASIVPGYTGVSSFFNEKRFHPELRKYRGHEGIDIAAPEGSSIYSPPMDGVVVTNGYDNKKGGFGNYVVIQKVTQKVQKVTGSPISLPRQ